MGVFICFLKGEGVGVLKGEEISCGFPIVSYDSLLKNLKSFPYNTTFSWDFKVGFHLILKVNCFRDFPSNFHGSVQGKGEIS